MEVRVRSIRCADHPTERVIEQRPLPSRNGCLFTVRFSVSENLLFLYHP